MNNLVTFFLDKKLLISRFLTTSPVHCAEFGELLVLTCFHFAQRYELRYRIDISDGNNYSQILQFFVGKIMLAFTMFS